MYLKKIIISGFGSYRDRNELSELSPKHNVIIGGNGCGKSNIFSAIQFVLSDEFSHLKAEERQQLIHENNSNTRLMTAFVEIILDNSDHRMPFDSNNISIRRQIGLKKDQYFINGKIISYSDVVNLLETAGFSRSNPYYIVKQGKVNEMAISSDEYRLNVMREVAGTRIYDQRKTQAFKLLSNSQQNIERITDCLNCLNEKLATLEVEKKDLSSFFKWDKRRRVLEYIILNTECESAKNEIAIYEDKQIEINDILQDKKQKLHQIQERAQYLSHKLKGITDNINDYRNDLNEINKSIEDLAKNKAEIESKIKDSKEKSVFDERTEKKVNKELNELNEMIARKKKRLALVNNKYEELKKKEKEVSQELKRKECRRIELYEKQKRKDKFTTVEARNEWISSELHKLEEEIEAKRKRISRLKAEAFQLTNEKSKLEDEQNGFIIEEEKLIKTFENERKQWLEINKKVKEYDSKRKELWDLENTLRQEENKLMEEKNRIESKLVKMAGNSGTVGRESVRKVLEMFRIRSNNSREEEQNLKPIISGYFGQVIDCFTCEPNLNKALEVTLKSKLFYHIVENDKIGTKIMQEINKNKMLGDITFIALNKLVVKQIKYPNVGKDAIPLTKLIKFDNKYEKVMKYLFDRTLICRNLEIATTLARSSKLDCVTCDADFVSHKGLMSGGYVANISKIELFLDWKNSVSQLEDNKRNLIQTAKQKERNEELLTQESESLNALDIQNNKTKRKLENLVHSKESIRKRLIEMNKKYESFERSIACLEETIPSLVANRDSFNSELKLSLDSQLNENETNEMNKLSKDIEDLKSNHSHLLKKLIEYEKEKSKLESNLDQNLIARQNELQISLIEIKISKFETHFESQMFSLNLIDKKINSIRKQFEERNEKIDELMKQELDIKSSLEDMKSAEDKQKEIVDNEIKKLRKLANKSANSEKKLEECNKKLRNLGTIPSDEKNYTSLTLLEQYEKLRLCNQKLTQFSNVNQKALEQFNDGKEKAQILMKEKLEIDSAYSSIQQLIDSLEHKKYEAIQFTYRQVSTFFKEIFHKLVPEGKAFIDMIYSDVQSSSESGSSQTSQSSVGVPASAQVSAIDNFIGVKIRVAFTGSATIKELNQLSGGQKSIVALAFIFAIQKCDPAPFYLFDEVDHALDPIYRKALADIIKESSKTTQFITITFRPELLDCAHKFFGVKFANRVSHVQEISAQMAKDFIEDDSTADQSKTRYKSIS